MRTLLRLRDDETLLVQSGKPVGVFRTHVGAPRVLIANSLLVPKWATWDEFRRLEAEGLTMFGQMTAGSWIYIGTQGILQGTYQTFCAAGEVHFGSADLSGRTVLTAGLGGMGGAQPLAATMAGAAILCVEVDQRSIDRRLATRYVDEQASSLDDAISRVRRAAAEGRPLSVALLGNAADVFPELVARGERFDLVTDQTAAHDPLTGYVPAEVPFEEAAALRARDPKRYLELASQSIVTHVRAMCDFVRMGCYVFDYGNNLRGEAHAAGLSDAFSYPGFVPAYIGRSSAAASARSAGRCSPAIPPTSRRLIASCRACFPTTSSCSGGSRWLPTRSHSRACPHGSAGWATAIAPKPASRSTSSFVRPRLGARRDRPRSPRLRVGRLALSRDRGDAGRL